MHKLILRELKWVEENGWENDLTKNMLVIRIRDDLSEDSTPSPEFHAILFTLRYLSPNFVLPNLFEHIQRNGIDAVGWLTLSKSRQMHI